MKRPLAGLLEFDVDSRKTAAELASTVPYRHPVGKLTRALPEQCLCPAAQHNLELPMDVRPASPSRSGEDDNRILLNEISHHK